MASEVIGQNRATMLTIEVYDNANNQIGTVQSPVIPRIGETVTYEGGIFTVQSVDFAFQGSALVAIRLRIG
jgi:hypothetical protein